MTLQFGEENLVGSFLSQSLLTLYLFLRIFKHMLSLLEATIQANFVVKAELVIFIVLKPRPPSFLGRHS